jgi:hypothetical protein
MAKKTQHPKFLELTEQVKTGRMNRRQFLEVQLLSGHRQQAWPALWRAFRCPR